MEIDTDILYSPAYWIMTGIAIVGLFIGLSGSLLGNLGIGSDTVYKIPFLLKAIIIICVPVLSYIIFQRMGG